VATELPLHYQGVLAALTDYDFVIASICQRLEEYYEFNKLQRRKGRFVVLDNGAFEGELLDEVDLVDIVEDLQPQEVVAPDVIGNRNATFKRSSKFIDLLQRKNIRVQIQVCPQGRNFEEWAESYRELANLPGVSVIGVSYVGHFDCPEDCDYFGDLSAEEVIRLRFFHYLVGQKLLRSDKAHHLLGLFSPGALRWYARYPFIRSIDTSFPVVCALHRTVMNRTTSKFPDKLDYGVQMTDESLALAVHNIEFMKMESCR
jgi:hypothetical protein